MVDIDVPNHLMMLNSIYKLHLGEEDSVQGKSELDHYLLNGCEDLKGNKFDILNWWKVNSTKYQILSHIARDVLPIPVSTVASEFAFMNENRVLDDFESLLSPKIVEALICAQNWLRCSPIDLHEALEEIEGYQIEPEMASECLLSMDSMEPMAFDV